MGGDQRGEGKGIVKKRGGQKYRPKVIKWSKGEKEKKEEKKRRDF